MPYKVAQEQLRKLLEEVKEKEDDFQNSEDRSSSNGSSSHVSGEKNSLRLHAGSAAVLLM
jgi:hypothetical protein